MIAALIFVISLVALLQFFISYCRSIVAASRKQPLSLSARDVTGIQGLTASGEEFQRILQLVHLCPEPLHDGTNLRVVHAYFGLLDLIQSTLARLVPVAGVWAERERGGCAYFAAVALDRRIAFSRELMAQQFSDRP